MNDIPQEAPPPQEALADDVVNVPNALPSQTVDKEEPAPEPKKAKSAGDSVKEAMDKVLKAEPEAKAEPKPEKVEKPAAEAKPEAAKTSAAAEKPDTTAGQDGEDKPPSEGKQVNAPARLLPKAREVWANTPRAVQAEFERMEREHAAEAETHREAKELHTEIKQYADMAKQSGTTIKQALDRYVDFDRKIAADFGQGMAEIAKAQGKQPQEAVAQLLRAYGMTPQQYAQHVTQNPQAHQMQPRQQQQQAPQPDPVAQQALKEVESLKAQLAARDLESQVIAPFAKDHPRMEELQDTIAKFLQSGMVPASLSPAERLAVAYDMAERVTPSPSQPAAAFADPDPEPAPAPAANGKKSISGAPGNGLAHKGKPKVMSIKESIAAAMRTA